MWKEQPDLYISSEILHEPWWLQGLFSTAPLSHFTFNNSSFSCVFLVSFSLTVVCKINLRFFKMSGFLHVFSDISQCPPSCCFSSVYVWNIYSKHQIQPYAYWCCMSELIAVWVSNKLVELSEVTCVIACSYFSARPRQIVVVLVIDFPFFYFRSPLRCHRSALSITQWRWACLMPLSWSTRSNKYPVSLKHTFLGVICTRTQKETLNQKKNKKTTESKITA